MTDLSVSRELTAYKAKHKIRFVTAASLFDGHDASINIMRRILQASGCEVNGTAGAPVATRGFPPDQAAKNGLGWNAKPEKRR